MPGGVSEAGFQKAEIRIEREAEFCRLRDAVERVLAPAAAEKFLKRLRRKGLRVRQLEAILAAQVLERLDAELARSGQTGRALYDALTVSDQGQMREFYLTRVEQIEAPLRARFRTQFETY